MAEVPYKASPNVEPSDAPFRPFEPRVGAETFGGLIAKGIGEFGQQATQTGELWGQLQVDAQSNKTTEALDKAVADLKTHRGQDALTYGQDFDDRVEQIISQGGEGLSAYQLKLYENQVRRYAHISRGEATTWLQSQGAAVAEDTNVGKYNAATTLAARDPNSVLDFQPNPELHADDPNNVPLAIKMGREAAARQLHWKGMDQNPDAFRIAMQNADAGVYKTSIETMYARDHDPEAAARAVEKLGPDKLGAANYATLSKDFESLSEAAQGRDWAARKSFEPVPYVPAQPGLAVPPATSAVQAPTTVGAPAPVENTKRKAGQSYYDWLNENPVAKPRAEAPQINMFANETPGIANAPGQQAISAALQHTVNAHTDRNLFSSGAARRMGIEGGVGQNLVSIGTNPEDGTTVRANARAAPHFIGFIKELEGMGYKINSLGGYNDRMIRGTRTYSEHAFGNAIDINPDENPQHGGTNLPPNVGQIAAKYGLIWGGDWSLGSRDPMHFEWSGKETPQRIAGEEKYGR